MSVTVQQLTKTYGSQQAVDAVTFSAKKGEILGFLGPNGAGKTTTMKIITCYLPQTSGKVEVCGYDVATAPEEVKKRVGYLPEHNPLYKEMYVREYLDFVAKAQSLAKRKSRIDEMIEMTGLEREQRKQIGALSKGYRQRVGLAQAMIHDPEVLILDEPTSGLDPNQLAEIRALIKNLGKEKTVIFSTHIMQEVQQLCDRVVIINQGKLVADDPIAALQQRMKAQRTIRVELAENIAADRWKELGKSLKIKHLEGNIWEITVAEKQDVRADIFNFAVQQNLTILEMHTAKSSVEDVFQYLTK